MGALSLHLVHPCIVAAIVFIAYRATPIFYFYDDVQTSAFHVLRDIGSKVLAREFPFLTVEVFNGDNYALEYQWGIFNPVNLLGAVLVASSGGAEVAMTLHAALFLGLCYLGTLFMARVFGLGWPMAVLAATSVACLPWLTHVYARAWLPGLTSFCWFPWYVGCLGLFARGRVGRRSVAGTALSLALLLTAGWPQGVVAAAIVTLVFLTHTLGARRGLRGAGTLVLALASGTLLAMPALLPFALGLRETARPALFATDGLYTVLLDGLVAMSGPTYLSRVPSFSREPYLPVPAYFVGAFYAPLSLIALARGGAGFLRDWSARALVVGSAVLLPLLLLPAYVGPFRWPMRWIVYLQCPLIVAGLLLVSRAGPIRLDRVSWGVTLAYFSLVALLSLRDTPELARWHLAGAGLAGAATLLMAHHHRRPHLLAGLGCVAVLAGYAGHVWNPVSHRHMLDFGVPYDGIRLAPASIAGGTTLLLDQMHHWHPLAQGRGHPVAAPGLAVMGQGGRVLAGYSSIGHRAFVAFACMEHKGAHLCPDVLDRMLARDEATGLRMIDAFKVNHVLVERTSPWFEPRMGELSPDFTEVSGNEFLRQWRRMRLNDLPGTLSILPQGVTVRGHERSSDARERYSLTSEAGSGGGEVVFARLHWPGYSAYLNGREIPVTAFRDMLVMVRLPPVPHADLVIEYRPRGIGAGLLAAASGAALLIALTFMAGKAGRSSRGAASRP